jgi:hypothetical protein
MTDKCQVYSLDLKSDTKFITSTIDNMFKLKDLVIKSYSKLFYKAIYLPPYLDLF